MKEIVNKNVFYRFWTQIHAALELCYYIEAKRPLDKKEMKILKHFLSSNGLYKVAPKSVGTKNSTVEIGPKLNQASPWSDRARGSLLACGVLPIVRIEYSTRHLLPKEITREEFIKNSKHDVINKMVYEKTLNDFGDNDEAERAHIIPVLTLGAEALKVWGYNDSDAKWWADFFVNTEKRNPTESEVLCIKMGRTEHSNHPFFSSSFEIDGKEYPALFEIVKRAYKRNPNNAVCAFYDNASAVGAIKITIIEPSKSLAFKQNPRTTGCVIVEKNGVVHISLKVETHNFPSGVAPFHGAATGGGIRHRPGAGRATAVSPPFG